MTYEERRKEFYKTLNETRSLGEQIDDLYKKKDQLYKEKKLYGTSEGEELCKEIDNLKWTKTTLKKKLDTLKRNPNKNLIGNISVKTQSRKKKKKKAPINHYKKAIKDYEESQKDV